MMGAIANNRMHPDIDGPQPTRPGEELDVATLEGYLREHLPEVAGPLTVEQFPRGFSNLTYSLRMGEEELVLRRPPFGNVVKTAHDMGREYDILSKLCDVYPLAPRPYLYCEDDQVLGAPFYVMERRRGIVLRDPVPETLDLAPAVMQRLGEALIDNFALLHSLDYRAAGLGDRGKPAGYVERQVTGWTKRYRNAQTSEIPSVERVAQWLDENKPKEGGAALIHNDYKYDNLLLDPDDLTTIVAVFDWEMATVGDPLMDLGTTLGYWVESGDPEASHPHWFGPTALPGNLSRRGFVERYESKTGREVPNPVFYYCFGLFKIAVIVQQIYARYVRGHTRDPRFAQLDDVVAMMGRRAVRALDSGSI